MNWKHDIHGLIVVNLKLYESLDMYDCWKHEFMWFSCNWVTDRGFGGYKDIPFLHCLSQYDIHLDEYP